MRTPMNQSNVYNQHTLSYIYQKPVQTRLQTKSLLTAPQDTPQTARRKLNSNPIHYRQKIYQ